MISNADIRLKINKFEPQDKPALKKIEVMLTMHQSSPNYKPIIFLYLSARDNIINEP